MSSMHRLRNRLIAAFLVSTVLPLGARGLGLSIARKNALLSGGDLVVVDGELGGAGFRMVLPAAADAVVEA